MKFNNYILFKLKLINYLKINKHLIYYKIVKLIFNIYINIYKN